MSEEKTLVNNVQFYMKNDVNTWLFNKYESGKMLE